MQNKGQEMVYDWYQWKLLNLMSLSCVGVHLMNRKKGPLMLKVGASS